MTDLKMIRDSLQIPLRGERYRVINICALRDAGEIAINLQRNNNPEDDEPHFINILQATHLLCELRHVIRTLEEEGIVE